MTKPTLIPISVHSDERGELRYCNEFDLSTAKRFYAITFGEKDQVRAWQAHKIETKAIMPISGISKIVLVELSDFDKGIAEEIVEYTLDASYPTILLVPEGYANGLQSKSSDSSLMIFSNLSLEEAKDDDFRFEKEWFYIW
ncbi:WxcM-like domain-containing protein [Algoriphagus sp. D3-2-R+10]|uniref:WxcM-like domain-containing protein n=1 Tax=Algoriphagus aurantiacus TaxID=3103948 RepID=UPI002B3980FD|nr:WxcM-like domain-containing protein [Algoriphagus sp. D3-2-R+10]MEB2778404.1 WxcM-like domain-containing protein [Algoriphagus sp. D3-2-R+10]